MNKISIVIPCYNEAESLPELIDQIRKVKNYFNFVLVDNGSKDDTQKVLENLKIPDNIKILKKKINDGYGSGIKFGLKNVETEYCGWMHSDLQQNISVLLDAKNLIEKLNKKGNDNPIALKGLRIGRSPFENLFTVGVAVFSSILFLQRFWDIAGQPNIFKTSEIKFLDQAPDDHKFEFYVYIEFLRNHGKFIRFDAPFHERRFGVSSWDKGFLSKLKHAKVVLKYILYLKFK
tara:strand:+ start:377 stop:1075 length:699 start_codon:yes stop_codon:yes gene_type:complete